MFRVFRVYGLGLGVRELRVWGPGFGFYGPWGPPWPEVGSGGHHGVFKVFFFYCGRSSSNQVQGLGV